MTALVLALVLHAEPVEYAVYFDVFGKPATRAWLNEGTPTRSIPAEQPVGGPCLPLDAFNELLVKGDPSAISPIAITCSRRASLPSDLTQSAAFKAMVASFKAGTTKAQPPKAVRTQQLTLEKEPVTLISVSLEAPASGGEDEEFDRLRCERTFAKLPTGWLMVAPAGKEACLPDLQSLRVRQAFRVGAGPALLDLDVGLGEARTNFLVRWNGKRFELVLKGHEGNG